MTNEEAIGSIRIYTEIHRGEKPRVADITEAHVVAINALEKQIPKKPTVWKNWYIDSPIPNDDWGYACPCCGNEDIDYPEHHCECGQSLDWSDIE